MSDLTDIAGGLGGGVGSLLGGAAVLAGAGGKGGTDQYKQALAVLQKVQDPSFDFSNLSPPELQVFAQYFPETYNAVVPENVKQVVENPELQLSQLRTLGRFEQTAQEGLPLQERLAAQDATRAISGENQRANETAIRDVAARGRLGTADELTARLQANQGQSELERDLGSSLAQNAIANRQGALAQAGTMAGQVRGQDFQAQSKNADIMNRLAELISQQKTQAAQYNAAAAERAQNANQGLLQSVGEQNTMNQYNVANENLNRRNQLQSLLSDFRLRKAGGQAGALSGYGNVLEQNKAAREKTIMNMGQGAGQATGYGAGLAFG